MHFSFAACSFRCASIFKALGQPLLRSFSMGSFGALLQKSFCGTSCLMVSLETLALDIPHTSNTKRLEIGLWRTWCCRTGGVWCWRICVWELQEPSVAMWIRQGARGVIITVEKAASWTSTNIRCLNLVFRNSMKLCNRDQKGTFKALLGEERSHPRMRFETHRHTLALTPANLFRTMFGRPCTLWNLGNWESSFRLFQKLPNPSEICDFRQRGYTLGDLISRDLYDTERVLGSKSLLWTHSNMTQWPMSRPKAVEIWWNM